MDFLKGEVLYIDKPLDWTSFSVVNKLRWAMTRTLKVKHLKVGHAGTLDPKATGVLIVCTGAMTKHIDTLQAQTKEYVATLCLGATTPSFDLELPVDKTFPTEHITRQSTEEVLNRFTGEIWQTPPVYSAVKIDGKRAYNYAREGKTVEMPSKLLVIDELELLDFSQKQISIRVVCSKGTYIRALARDIGVALGSGAHLLALRRTRIGNVRVEDCMTIEEAMTKIANS